MHPPNSTTPVGIKPRVMGEMGTGGILYTFPVLRGPCEGKYADVSDPEVGDLN